MLATRSHLDRGTAALAAMLVVTWASAFAAIRNALEGFGPGALTVARLSVAGLVFVVAVPFLRIRVPARRHWPRVLGCALFGQAAYHLLLRSGEERGEEMARLVDELTINETYFLRERAQLLALTTEIVPELRAARDGRPVQIWSAGCSSGEEPYSVVILGREAGLVPGVDFRVYASDISHRMLRRAREGVYREASLR